jgi:hypothetical protein
VRFAQPGNLISLAQEPRGHDDTFFTLLKSIYFFLSALSLLFSSSPSLPSSREQAESDQQGQLQLALFVEESNTLPAGLC